MDSHINMERKLLNRIKVVLAEKNRSNKWLSEQLDKDPAIISKWVTNTTQPNVETLIQISKVLGENGIINLWKQSNYINI